MASMFASLSGNTGVPPATRTSQADLAPRDWLETQSRVVGYWRDLLLERGGDDGLIAALEEHAAFLQAAVMGRV